LYRIVFGEASQNSDIRKTLCQFAGFRDNEQAYHDAAKRATKMVGRELEVAEHLADEFKN
jgi:hypothetical protein